MQDHGASKPWIQVTGSAVIRIDPPAAGALSRTTFTGIHPSAIRKGNKAVRNPKTNNYHEKHQTHNTGTNISSKRNRINTERDERETRFDA